MLTDNKKYIHVLHIIASMSGTLASRVLGLARDILIAFALGAGGDVFLAAFRIPNVFRRFSAEGVFSLSHGVSLGKYTNTDSEAKQKGILNSLYVAIFFSFWTTVLAIFLCIFAFPVMGFLVAGMPHAEVQKTVVYFRICLAYVPLSVFLGIITTTLIHYKKVGKAAFSPVMLNVGILAFGIASLFLAGDRGVYFSLGVFAGGCLQMVWLLYHLRQLQTSPYFFFIQKNKQQKWLQTFCAICFSPSEAVRAVCINLPLTLITAAGSQIIFVVSMWASSFLPAGSISGVYFAERLIEFPVAILGISIATATMPAYAKLATNREELGKTLQKSLHLVFFLSLPATVGIFCLAIPIVNVLFGHGLFGKEGAMTASFALLGMSPCIVAMCLYRSLHNACIALDYVAQSQHYTKIMAYIVLFACGVTILVASMSKVLFGIFGVGLAVSIGAWVQTLLLYFICKKAGLLQSSVKEIKKTIQLLLAAVLLGGAFFILQNVYSPQSLWASALYVFFMVCGVIGLWVGGFYYIKNDEAVFLLQGCMRMGKNILSKPDSPYNK